MPTESDFAPRVASSPSRTRMLRRMLLRQIYEEVHSDVSLELSPAELYEMAADLEMTPEEATAAAFYGYEAGLLEGRPLVAGEDMAVTPTRITVKGVDFVEEIFKD